jgi:hypothetical protein
MHTINVHREEIGACWEVQLDGKFVSASPSKALVGEVVLEQLRRLGEAVLIGVTDDGPVNREKHERERRGHEQATVPGIVEAARAHREPWRP